MKTITWGVKNTMHMLYITEEDNQIENSVQHKRTQR